MPRLDPGMQSGKIVEWLKKEGDSVEKDEPVAIIEGEKTTFEVNAPQAGLVRRLLFDIGADVEVGHAIALVGDPNEPIPSELGGERKLEVAAPRVEPAAPVQVAAPEEARASPAARKIAREAGVDISRIKGSGPGGRIVREDVQKAIEDAKRQPRPQPPSAPHVRTASVVKAFKLSGKRKATAERLSFSFHTTVPTTIAVDISMESIIKHRKGLQAATSGDVSVTAYAVKAAALALRDYPQVNSSLDGEEIRVHGDVNVAVAVNTNDGLVAPVIPNADKKTVGEISTSIRNLTELAEQNKLSISDLTGGTFTVSNLGGHGVELFVPIINPPQCAILGFGRTYEKPVVVGGQVQVAPIGTFSLVFDHRIIDGVLAAQFLQRIKQLMENPKDLES